MHFSGQTLGKILAFYHACEVQQLLTPIYIKNTYSSKIHPRALIIILHSGFFHILLFLNEIRS